MYYADMTRDKTVINSAMYTSCRPRCIKFESLAWTKRHLYNRIVKSQKMARKREKLTRNKGRSLKYGLYTSHSSGIYMSRWRCSLRSRDEFMIYLYLPNVAQDLFQVYPASSQKTGKDNVNNANHESRIVSPLYICHISHNSYYNIHEPTHYLSMVR